MSGKILDYLILAIIFAVVIHIFIKSVKSTNCSKYEHLEEETQDEQEQEQEEQEEQEEVSTVNNIVDTIINSQEQVQQIQPVQQVKPTQSPDACMVNGMDINNDRYVREFVLGGKYNCTPDVQYTREDTQKYQDDFFKFNERINFSTNQDVTHVDKLNETNNDISGFFGKKMSDVYNELTGVCQEKKDKCVNKNCLIPPTIDTFLKGGSYSSEGSFKKYNYMYEDDNENNGGKFYDNIEASDDEFESSMMW